MGVSSSLLSQTFSLLLHQLALTLDPLWEFNRFDRAPPALPVPRDQPKELYDFVWAELNDVWEWLFNCLDLLQTQLSFGSSVSKKVSGRQ